MGEAVWPTKPLGAQLATMFQVVVVLLGQHEDQLINGILWMKVYIQPLDTQEWESPKCMCKMVDIWP